MGGDELSNFQLGRSKSGRLPAWGKFRLLQINIDSKDRTLMTRKALRHLFITALLMAIVLVSAMPAYAQAGEDSSPKPISEVEIVAAPTIVLTASPGEALSQEYVIEYKLYYEDGSVEYQTENVTFTLFNTATPSEEATSLTSPDFSALQAAQNCYGTLNTDFRRYTNKIEYRFDGVSVWQDKTSWTTWEAFWPWERYGSYFALPNYPTGPSTLRLSVSTSVSFRDQVLGVIRTHGILWEVFPNGDCIAHGSIT